jgi:hypothetical protein
MPCQTIHACSSVFSNACLLTVLRCMQTARVPFSRAQRPATLPRRGLTVASAAKLQVWRVFHTSCERTYERPRSGACALVHVPACRFLWQIGTVHEQRRLLNSRPRCHTCSLVSKWRFNGRFASQLALKSSPQWIPLLQGLHRTPVVVRQSGEPR